MKNELEIVVKESGLETNQASSILEKFVTFFEQAKNWEEKAKNLVVKDETDTVTMEKAREARLALKKIRTDAEKVRKEMKEEYIRTGKAIDGVANVIKALVIPIEKHLEKQEKFIENLKIEKENRIKAERISKLSPYLEKDEYGSIYEALSLYNFDSMTDEMFDSLLDGIKISWEKKQKEIKEIEDKRIADEKKAKIEAEKNRIEVEKLRKEKEERDLKEAKEKKEADAKLKIERDARIKLEKELKDKEITNLKKKQEEDAKLKAEQDAKEKAKRDAELAPEKEKLTNYSEEIRTIKSPEGLSKAGLEVVKSTEEKLLAISQEIKLKIKEL